MNHPPTARQHRRGHRGLAALAATALVAVELVATVAPATAAPHDDVDYTSFVDPFIGTESDFGQDGPGAFTPNGLAKVTPLTEPRSHTGYDYDSTQMLGFTGITLDGVGGNGAGGDFLVVPTYQTFTARPSTSSYRKGYSHANEEASPGLYAIDDLAEGSRTIDARVTAATRTGVHEYTFDQAGTGSLVVDLRNNFGSRNGATLSVGTTAEGNTSLSGRLDGFFYNASYRMYYYAETTRPASSVQTWRDADLSITQRTQEAAHGLEAHAEQEDPAVRRGQEAPRRGLGDGDRGDVGHGDVHEREDDARDGEDPQVRVEAHRDAADLGQAAARQVPGHHGDRARRGW